MKSTLVGIAVGRTEGSCVGALVGILEDGFAEGADIAISKKATKHTKVNLICISSMCVVLTISINKLNIHVYIYIYI